MLLLNNSRIQLMKNFIHMKKIIFSIGILATCTLIFGQSHVDALRYSQPIIGGTARYVAMGGAFGALGGDFSSLSHNPAGLAVYRGSEFTFSPEFNINTTTTRYFGQQVTDSKFTINLNNLGYVGSYKNDNGELKYVNFGIGYNKVANFNKSYTINGDNPFSTYGDYMAELANNYGLENFGSGLFYRGHVIGDVNSDHYYVNEDYFYHDTITEQKITSDESGKINEYDFSIGLNFSDVFYFGGSVGILPLHYNSDKVTREYDAAERSYQFFKFREKLRVHGTGYTANIGAIVRPVPMLRLGIAYNLPVTYFLHERYTPTLESNWTSGIIYPGDIGASSDYLENDYKITTPGKVIGSAALVLGKFLILSSDLEYVNYANMRMSSQNDDFNDQNELIKQVYTDNFNLKLGSEFRMGTMYFRGGVAYFGSPYAASEENSDAFKLNYSCGFGIRDDKFFFDVAYQFSNSDERQYQYSVYVWNKLYEPVANLDTKTHRILTTFGFRF
jgi:hypothetical protein